MIEQLDLLAEQSKSWSFASSAKREETNSKKTRKLKTEVDEYQALTRKPVQEDKQPPVLKQETKVDSSAQEALQLNDYLKDMVARNNPELLKRINSLADQKSEEKPKHKKKAKEKHEMPRRSNTGNFEEMKDKEM